MFQRNHLLDFENFLKKCPTKRPADRGISRPARREPTADCGSSSVITFWTLSKFQNISKSAVGRDAPMKVSRLAGRERLADCGSSSVITFWTLSKFQNISRSVVGRDAPMKVSRLAGRERLADCGSSSVITFWTLSKFQNISRSVVGRDPAIGVFLDRQLENDSPMGSLSTGGSRRIRRRGSLCWRWVENHLRTRDFPPWWPLGLWTFFKVRSGKRRAHEGLSTSRSRTTRRLRIFKRNHLLDFVKISNYFKVRSGKRPADRGLSRPAGQERPPDCGSSSVITFWTVKISNYFKVRSGKRPTDRGLSRPVGREGLADCGSSSIITFWTLKIFWNFLTLGGNNRTKCVQPWGAEWATRQSPSTGGSRDVRRPRISRPNDSADDGESLPSEPCG